MVDHAGEAKVRGWGGSRLQSSQCACLAPHLPIRTHFLGSISIRVSGAFFPTRYNLQPLFHSLGEKDCSIRDDNLGTGEPTLDYGGRTLISQTTDTGSLPPSVYGAF